MGTTVALGIHLISLSLIIDEFHAACRANVGRYQGLRLTVR
jgi:hypothetical protein